MKFDNGISLCIVLLALPLITIQVSANVPKSDVFGKFELLEDLYAQNCKDLLTVEVKKKKQKKSIMFVSGQDTNDPLSAINYIMLDESKLNKAAWYEDMNYINSNGSTTTTQVNSSGSSQFTKNSMIVYEINTVNPHTKKAYVSQANSVTIVPNSANHYIFSYGKMWGPSSRTVASCLYKKI